MPPEYESTTFAPFDSVSFIRTVPPKSSLLSVVCVTVTRKSVRVFSICTDRAEMYGCSEEEVRPATIARLWMI